MKFPTLSVPVINTPPNNQPVCPQGYAHPQQKQWQPQRFAEIMAGRRALSKNSA